MFTARKRGLYNVPRTDTFFSLVTNFFAPETFYIKIFVVSCSCSDMISCTLLFCLHTVLFVVALPIASRSLALRALYLEDAVYQPRKALPLSPVSFKTQIFFSLFHGLALWWAMQTENVHRRSDEPFWRKVPSRMTGNSSNFTDANRRVSQPGLRLWPRCRSRDDDRSGNWGLNHGVGRGYECVARTRRPQSCRC